MNDQEFINWLWYVVAGGVGGVGIFAFIEWLVSFRPGLLDADAKFNLAQLLALLLPPAAYGGLVALGAMEWSVGGVAIACFTGYAASQRIHREREKHEQPANV